MDSSMPTDWEIARHFLKCTFENPATLACLAVTLVVGIHGALKSPPERWWVIAPTPVLILTTLLAGASLSRAGRFEKAMSAPETKILLRVDRNGKTRWLIGKPPVAPDPIPWIWGEIRLPADDRGILEIDETTWKWMQSNLPDGWKGGLTPDTGKRQKEDDRIKTG